MKKCAIVTGGASGIGKACANAFIEEGHTVVIADFDQRAGEHAAHHPDMDFIQTDLSKREECKRLVAEATERYGKVDILVNNAGIQHVAPIEDFPEDKWDDLLKVLITAPFLLTKYVWPAMQEQGWGRIINIASIHSEIASLNKVGYVSAKHGLVGLTKSAALEGGKHGITVNALSPSYVKTPLVENQVADQARTRNIPEEEVINTVMLEPAAIKRLIEPEEVSNIVSLLCSDKGASITGSNWKMDCGWTAK